MSHDIFVNNEKPNVEDVSFNLKYKISEAPPKESNEYVEAFYYPEDAGGSKKYKKLPNQKVIKLNFNEL